MGWLTVEPTTHALSMAGVDLLSAQPPIVRVEVAREVVVVLSRSRDPRREADLDRCRADRVPIVVRPSGGGAVLLAPGVVVASVLAAAAGNTYAPGPLFARFGEAVASALGSVGAHDVRMRGVSDLCNGDRKLAGSSLRLWAGRVLYQVSVLVDVDVSLIERYLALPSRQPDYRAGRSHRDFVVTLRELGCGVSREEAAASLHRHLTEAGVPLRAAGPDV